MHQKASHVKGVLTFVVFSLITIQFLVSSVGGQNVCGKALTESHSTLQTSDYPFPMPGKSSCNWTFNLTNASALVYLNIEEVSLFPMDILTIDDGVNKYAFDGSNVSQLHMWILSAVNSSIQITFTDSGNTTGNRRLMASYTTEITENVLYLQKENGIIRSPNYTAIPKTVEFANYTWVVTQIPGSSIYLSFKMFNIGSGTLDFQNGNIHHSFTGSRLPNDIATSVADIRLRLSLPLNVSGLGFELYYSILHPNCSNTVEVTNQTEIKFEISQSDAPIRCFTVVKGPEDAVLSARVCHASIVEANPLSSSVLTVNDGGSQFSPNLLAYSTSSLAAAPHVVSSNNVIWLGLLSADRVSVNLSLIVTVHSRGGSLFGNGTFSLPKLPANVTTPSNTSEYILTVASGEEVFTLLQPNASLGSNSSIQFYDGASQERLLANFTAATFASNSSYPVLATQSQMLVLATNFFANNTFTASFGGSPKGCNGLSSSNVDSYQLSRLKANSSCQWVIVPQHSQPSEIIALSINSLTLKETTVVVVYDGPSEKASVLYKLTTSTSNLVIYGNATTGLRVQVLNGDINNNVTGMILDASYQVQNGCRADVNLTALGGRAVITSPNYPHLYPANAQCAWNVTSKKSLLLLSIQDLHLPSTQPLLLYSTQNQTLKLIANVSSESAQDDIITSDAPVLIHWSSVLPLLNATVDVGFTMNIYELDCGGMMTENGTEFSTVAYPSKVTATTLCAWSVKLPEKDKNNNVEIISLSIASEQVKSSRAQLVIHEGGSMRDPSANVTVTDHTTYLSRTNKLFVTYNYTKDETGGTPFKFTYAANACTKADLCGNGLCLHPTWRCNGVNDCGDFTDEMNCSASTVVTASSGASTATLISLMFLSLLLGVGGAMAAPYVYRRFRSQGNYQEFRSTVEA